MLRKCYYCNCACGNLWCFKLQLKVPRLISVKCYGSYFGTITVWFSVLHIVLSLSSYLWLNNNLLHVASFLRAMCLQSLKICKHFLFHSYSNTDGSVHTCSCAHYRTLLLLCWECVLCRTNCCHLMFILPSQFDPLCHALWVCTRSWTVFHFKHHYGVLARWPCSQ